MSRAKAVWDSGFGMGFPGRSLPEAGGPRPWTAGSSGESRTVDALVKALPPSVPLWQRDLRRLGGSPRPTRGSAQEIEDHQLVHGQRTGCDGEMVVVRHRLFPGGASHPAVAVPAAFPGQQRDQGVEGASWRLRVCPSGLAEVAAAAAARP